MCIAWNAKILFVDRVLGACTWQCHWVSWRGEGFRSHAGHGQKDHTKVRIAAMNLGTVCYMAIDIVLYHFLPSQDTYWDTVHVSLPKLNISFILGFATWTLLLKKIADFA
jgi:hypothetical protein